MKTKGRIRSLAGISASGTNFEQGARDVLKAALAIPTREIRRWSAEQLDDFTDALRTENEAYLREYFHGRVWALRWIRSPG